MDIKTDNKKKNIIIFSILSLVLLILGGTFAYITLSATVTNGNYTGNFTCFNINYSVNNSDGTSDITGTLFPSSGPSGGINGAIEIGIDPDCNVNGLGSLQLQTMSTSSELFQTVSAHCEDSQTLSTMGAYTTQAECEAQTNGVWVTSGRALKYAIYNTDNVNSSTIPIKVGYVVAHTYARNILYNDFILYDVDSTTQSTIAANAGFDSDGNINYSIYIWLDGNLIDDSYQNLNFNARLLAFVVQADCDLTDSSCYTEHTS